MLKSSTMKKKITIILFSLIFLKINLFSQVYSQQQVFQADHWVFHALKTITLADSKMNFYETAPLSVAEIKFYMSNVDYDSLSKEGAFSLILFIAAILFLIGFLFFSFMQ